MGTQFAWYYDVVVAAILLIFLYIGGKRGFLKSFVLIAGYIAAFLLSYFVSSIASPIIYEHTLQPKITEIITEKIDNIDILGELKKSLDSEELGITFENDELSAVIKESSGNLGEDLESYITGKFSNVNVKSEDIDAKLQEIVNSEVVDDFLGSLPAYMQAPVKEYVDKSQETLSAAVKSLVGTKAEAAAYIEESFVREGIITMIKIIIFMVLFSLIMILVRAISGGLSAVNKIPVAGSLNTFLGMVLGLIQGVVILLIVALVLRVLISFTGNQMIVLNTQTIDETYLFRYFYDIELLK